MRVYKIKDTKSGLFFFGFMISRGLTKTGKPRKIGPYHLAAEFLTEEEVSYRNINSINSIIKRAILDKVPNFEDTEIIAYEHQKVPSSVKMETLKYRHQSAILVQRLRNGY